MPSTVKITTLEQLKVALQAAKTYIDNEIGCLLYTSPSPRDTR